MPKLRANYIDRTRPTHIHIPERTLAAVSTAFWDPTRKKVMYGALSALVRALLDKWVANPAICPIADLDINEDDMQMLMQRPNLIRKDTFHD